MFELVRKLMMAREFRMEVGEIVMFDQPIQFIPTNLFVLFLHESSEQDEQGRLIYAASKKTIESFLRDFAKQHTNTENALFEWALNVFALMGWGKVVPINANMDSGKFFLKVEDSAFASVYLENHGKADSPICHMIRGALAGCGNAISKENGLECIETKCKAMGHSHCEMMIKPKKEFIDNPPKEYAEAISKQLDLRKSKEPNKKPKKDV